MATRASGRIVGIGIDGSASSLDAAHKSMYAARRIMEPQERQEQRDRSERHAREEAHAWLDRIQWLADEVKEAASGTASRTLSSGLPFESAGSQTCATCAAIGQQPHHLAQIPLRRSVHRRAMGLRFSVYVRPLRQQPLGTGQGVATHGPMQRCHGCISTTRDQPRPLSSKRLHP